MMRRMTLPPRRSASGTARPPPTAPWPRWVESPTRGGVAAGVLFVLPGAAVMMVLSAIYALYGAVPVIAALSFGLKCAVLVVEALPRVAH